MKTLFPRRWIASLTMKSCDASFRKAAVSGLDRSPGGAPRRRLFRPCLRDGYITIADAAFRDILKDQLEVTYQYETQHDFCWFSDSGRRPAGAESRDRQGPDGRPSQYEKGRHRNQVEVRLHLRHHPRGQERAGLLRRVRAPWPACIQSRMHNEGQSPAGRPELEV